MTAREYLEQLTDIDLEIQAKEKQKAHLKKRKANISSPKLGDKVKTSHENNSNKIIDDIVTLEQEITEDIAKLVKIEADVTKKINHLSNPTYRMILINKYINGIPLVEIATDEYSERQLKRLHKRALKSLTVICGFDEEKNDSKI